MMDLLKLDLAVIELSWPAGAPNGVSYLHSVSLFLCSVDFRYRIRHHVSGIAGGSGLLL